MQTEPRNSSALQHPPQAEKAFETYPAAWRGRPWSQKGANLEGRGREPQQLRRELGKMKLVLEAKRSQHRKMEQWSQSWFLSRLISRVYLDELGSDIAWLEAVVANNAHELDHLQHASHLKPEAQPRHPSTPLRKGIQVGVRDKVVKG